jgi:hypothetical protein
MALIPIIWVISVLAGKFAASIFVTETHVAIELKLGNGGR